MIYTEILESELNLRQEGHSFGLVPTLVLVPMEADPITKKRGCKRSTANGVRARGTGGIEMILAVFGPVSLAYGFGTNGLSLKEKIHAEHCHRLKVFLGVLGGSYGGDWTSCIACEAPYSKESPRASGFLCPNGSVAGRFCKSKSLVSLLRSSESSN